MPASKPLAADSILKSSLPIMSSRLVRVWRVGADEQHLAHRFVFQFAQRHAVFFEEPNQVFARNTAILGTRNPIAAETAGIEPFADGAGCNLTDLGYLSSSEDRPHCGLSKSDSLCQLRGFVGPSRSSPLLRWPALLASGSVTYKNHRGFGSGFVSGFDFAPTATPVRVTPDDGKPHSGWVHFNCRCTRRTSVGVIGCAK